LLSSKYLFIIYIYYTLYPLTIYFKLKNWNLQRTMVIIGLLLLTSVSVRLFKSIVFNFYLIVLQNCILLLFKYSYFCPI
jgi:hypothetical protein